MLTDWVSYNINGSMARKRPPDRLQRLIECATGVFIEHGYAHAQMDRVAAALGVSKGTLYLYVESKEALFDVVIRALAMGDTFNPPEQLPIPTPRPDDTVAFVAEQLAKRQSVAALVAALERRTIGDVRAELSGIVTELYDALALNRNALKLLDRAAADHPALAELWFKGAREGVVGLLAEYIQDRARRGLLAASTHPLVLARVCVETLAFWAVHRHWDPQPQDVPEPVARQVATGFVVGALLNG